MLHLSKLFLAIILFFVGTLFAFVPKTFADDPCSAITNPPLLYQINRTPTQATLFFSPVTTDQVQSYTIIYGFKPEDERFSLTVNQGPSTGAISYAVNGLEPGVQYFYKVSGNTSCVNSPWSSWVGDKAVKTGSSVATPGIPVTGHETMFLWGICSLLIIVSGFGLISFSKRRV